MLKHTQIRKGEIIIVNGDPYEVIKHTHSVRGRGGSVMQTQLKNMRTGSVMQKTFHAGETVEEAEINKIDAVFAYSKRDSYVFHEKNNPANRFTLLYNNLQEKADFLKEKTPVEALFFEENFIGINLPVKMVFAVKEAPPGIKGDRAEGGSKNVLLETDKTLNVPLFVKEGDLVEVNTQTGEYVKRIIS